MKKYSVVLCVLVAFGAYHLTEVETTPVPPPRNYDDREFNEAFQPRKISLPKNKMRIKRGVPCPLADDHTESECEITEPCGCDPCDALRNAKEARILRKQHRKIVAEMKINRLKRKLHTAVCPKCALAQELELERKPCHKSHVDITFVVSESNPHGRAEVPVRVVEHPLSPPRQTSYTQVVQTESQVSPAGPAYGEPMLSEPAPFEPMVPRPQNEPMVPRPQFEPMVPRPQYGPMIPEPQYDPMIFEPPPSEGFGPAVPWMRSSAPDTAEKTKTMEQMEQDSKSKTRKAVGLLTIFKEIQNTTTEAPSDSEDAWPWKNATYERDVPLPTNPLLSKTNFTTEDPPYDSPEEAVPSNYTGLQNEGRSARAADESSLRAPPADTEDVLWQDAYQAASKAVESVMNTSFPSGSLKPSDTFPVKKNCSAGQCTKLCSEAAGCLENEVTQKGSSGMPYASALLTGLVSAIIGA